MTIEDFTVTVVDIVPTGMGGEPRPLFSVGTRSHEGARFAVERARRREIYRLDDDLPYVVAVEAHDAQRRIINATRLLAVGSLVYATIQTSCEILLGAGEAEYPDLLREIYPGQYNEARDYARDAVDRRYAEYRTLETLLAA